MGRVSASNIAVSTAPTSRSSSAVPEKHVRLTDEGATYAKEQLTPLYKLESTVVEMIGAERIREMMNTIKLYNTVFEKEVGNG